MISIMNVSAIRSDWVGRVVDGRFPLIQWLGGSERSAVFLTEFADGARTRKAVIKVIPADAWDAEARVAGWQASANLSHPNVVQLFSTGACQVDGFSILYAVTEYADEVLADILTGRPLTSEETGQMLGPVLDALAWIHSKGLVHGHVNPSNIMVVDDQVKLSGESLRVAGQPGTRPPSSGIYDAPESAAGGFEPQADLWSLGVTLVETLTQRRPAAPGLRQDDPVVPSNIAEPYATIARGCLRTDPARRFTIPDIRTALGIGRIDHESSEETSGKVPALARLGILVVPLIVISAAFAVHEVSVHMRAQVAASANPGEVQSVAISSQQKPSAGRLVSNPSADQQTATPVARQSSASVQPSVADQTSSSAHAPADSPPAAQPAVAPGEAPAAVTAPPQVAGASSNAAVLSQTMPEILPAASSSIHGKFTVRIRVEVDPSGNVSSAAYDSEGPSHYFAKQALDASQHWKFKPASAPSHWIIQYVFRESGTEVTTAPASN
jgi:serine/threonine protein kinase